MAVNDPKTGSCFTLGLTANRQPPTASGFTLIEFIVALTVGVIVMGFMAMLLATPVQAYLAQTRRAQLIDAADMASRHLARDIRAALPTSVRQRTNGSFRLLEMITVQPTIDGGTARYRPVLAPAPDTNLTLDVGNPDAGFSVLGQYLPAGSPPTALANRRLIVGRALFDPYTSANYITPAMTITIASLANDEETIALAAPFRFQNASLSNRVFLTSAAGTVAWLCDLTARTLRRYDGFPIAASATAHDTPGELAAVSATNTLIASDVTACMFRPVDPTDTMRGLVSVQISFNRNGEVLQMFDQVPLEIGP